MLRSSLWEKIEPLLGRIERPSRYLNHEYHAVSFPDAGYPDAEYPDVEYQVALLYPDTYELGQANQAIAILYHLINALKGCRAERVYLPWVDLLALMRLQDIPLFTLESTSPVVSFDLLGITLPHELAATNILEALDLAGIPLKSAERSAEHPLVLGGGPGAFNPEPMAAFFDAFAIGEGEELTLEIVAVHRACLSRGASRAELLKALAGIEGVYVPSLYSLQNDGSVAPLYSAVSPVIKKRVVSDFDACPIVTTPVVPFAEVSHDRFAVEILRGCTRGCRFCQAGMTYRPVRERKADTVVDAVARGIANTGFDEVSLTSLSTTDHSQIEQILRRLNHLFGDTGVSVSIPSQRLDAFGLEMAQLVAGEKKAGLTFAPEAGTQRLRDSINKNVTEANLLEAVRYAYSVGWRRCKLYFMIGLPGETDEDVRAIATLTNQAYAAAKDAVPNDRRSSVRMNVSVAVFVPKPHTPFQWGGQIARSEIERRIELLRTSGLHRGIDLHWHDPTASRIEAALARAGREATALVEEAWRRGCLFDAWSERFDAKRWDEAAEACGLSIAMLAERDFTPDEALAWDHIDSGVSKEFLAKELMRSHECVTTEDCSFITCINCGVCGDLGVRVDLESDRCG
ncbi:MAG: TIGR03960 family B12-binding radical SAM protein [Coriobacteriales bacterium]|jgi:radical SAM family uncharacterized protein|nr:TIGR03960 family B12-binding radical SAM protein [Coriobacteriales bacterium]